MPLRLVNLLQTKEERQAKYWLARSLGANCSWATRMRDWHEPKIARFFNLQEQAQEIKDITSA